jgi:predicted transcriptional regulator of viral defense system
MAHNMSYTARLTTPRRAQMANLARASKGGLLSVADAARALGTSRRAAAAHLARLTRNGWLQRARRGLYLVVPLDAAPTQRATAEDPWVLAREVFAPCYVGGWTAAEHWGLTEQLFRSTLVVSAAPIRSASADILGHTFRVFRAPRSRLRFGVVEVWRGAEKVSVSSRERTLVDCLRRPELCGGARYLAQILHAYGASPERDFARLVTVAGAVASGAAWKRLGYLAELFWPREAKLLRAAKRHLSAGHARLDPHVRRPGKLVTRWSLRVNVDVTELANREDDR